MVDVYEDKPPLEKPMAAENYASAFYHTFNLSQNDTEFQKRIFDFLHLDNPNWHISDSEKQEVFRITRERVLKKIYPENLKKISHIPQDTAFIDNQLGEQLDTMQGIFNGIADIDQDYQRDGYRKQGLLFQITQDIINLDFYYLVAKGGRQHRPPSQRYFSYFKTYVEEGHSIGIQALNKMLKEVRMHFYRAPQFNNSWMIDPCAQSKDMGIESPTQALQAIALTWENHHPGKDFFKDNYLGFVQEAN